MPDCEICGKHFQNRGIKTHQKACQKRHKEAFLDHVYLENNDTRVVPECKHAAATQYCTWIQCWVPETNATLLLASLPEASGSGMPTQPEAGGSNGPMQPEASGSGMLSDSDTSGSNTSSRFEGSLGQHGSPSNFNIDNPGMWFLWWWQQKGSTLLFIKGVDDTDENIPDFEQVVSHFAGLYQ